MPPREDQYATKAMIGWSVVIICAVMGGSAFSTSANNKSLLDATNKVFSARDAAQDQKTEFTEKRVNRLEEKQERDHEMIKNVETRLTGIEVGIDGLRELIKKSLGRR